MIVNIKGWQDKGKSAFGVGFIREILRIGAFYTTGFRPNDVVANCKLIFPGAHSINNIQMRKYIRAMIVRGLKHKIIFIDEADRVFPARFWHNQEQTDALIGLWQDYKLFNVIIMTCHLGSSVDVIIRESTQIEINVDYDEYEDTIYFIVYNAVDGLVYEDCIKNCREIIFPYYDRWEVIGQIAVPPGTKDELLAT